MLLVDSCRAGAELSSAVLNTFRFQKLIKILPSTRSLPIETKLSTNSPLHNMILLCCRYEWIMFCEVLSIMSGSKGDHWWIFQSWGLSIWYISLISKQINLALNSSQGHSSDPTLKHLVLQHNEAKFGENDCKPYDWHAYVQRLHERKTFIWARSIDVINVWKKRLKGLSHCIFKTLDFISRGFVFGLSLGNSTWHIFGHAIKCILTNIVV